MEILKLTKKVQLCEICRRVSNQKICDNCKQKQSLVTEKEKNKQLLLRLQRVAGIPTKFLDCTAQNFITRNEDMLFAKAVVQRYVDNLHSRIASGGGIIFSGKYGTGKTHLACAIARSSIFQGYKPSYTNFSKLIKSVKATWRKDSIESEDYVIKEHIKPDLLIIDEVKNASKFDEGILFEVINERYEEVKPTILITNLNQSSLIDCIGGAAFDRMMDNKGILLPFYWKSFRQSQESK